MPEGIQAGEKNLDKVFCNDYLFKIPVFQRPYSWTTEEVSELLDDLLFAMEQDDKEPYFLGCIVLIKGDEPESYVVDGQQRLTTLSMLLCLLRELADEHGVKNLIDGRIRQRSDPLTGAQEVVRVELRRQDRDFFHSFVQSEGGVESLLESTPETKTDAQTRILENVNFLNGKLTKLSTQERMNLASFIIARCYLVVVSTPNETSAFRIFSILNNRGLDLSATDILKAEIIGGLEEDEQESYGEKWEDIEQELGREKFNDLFTHIRMIYGKAKLRRNLPDEFREQVLRKHTGSDFIDHVLDQYDDVYKRVRGLDEQGQEAGRYLQFLRLLDNADWIPPVMAFFHRNPHSPALLGKFTRDLERLAFGLFLRRSNINDRISRYAEVLEDIEKDEDVCRDGGPLQLSIGEKKEVRDVLDGPIYTVPRVPRPLLLRLDSLLADAVATYDHPIISVEHVLPQSPKGTSNWLHWFPSEEERTYWTHRLANLVLLSSRKNAQASNYEFDHKKTNYFQRGGVVTFALTSQVLGEVEWTPQVLRERQSDLLRKLAIEWRLE